MYTCILGTHVLQKSNLCTHVCVYDYPKKAGLKYSSLQYYMQYDVVDGVLVVMDPWGDKLYSLALIMIALRNIWCTKDT